MDASLQKFQAIVKLNIKDEGVSHFIIACQGWTNLLPRNRFSGCSNKLVVAHRILININSATDPLIIICKKIVEQIFSRESSQMLLIVVLMVRL